MGLYELSESLFAEEHATLSNTRPGSLLTRIWVGFLKKVAFIVDVDWWSAALLSALVLLVLLLLAV